MKPLKGLFDHAYYHHDTEDLPRWVRRRMYTHLLSLIDEENRVGELLKLPTKPRLSVIDEERVAMIRRGDRQALNLDEEMQRSAHQARRGGGRGPRAQPARRRASA